MQKQRSSVSTIPVVRCIRAETSMLAHKPLAFTHVRNLGYKGWTSKRSDVRCFLTRHIFQILSILNIAPNITTSRLRDQPCCITLLKIVQSPRVSLTREYAHTLTSLGDILVEYIWPMHKDINVGEIMKFIPEISNIIAICHIANPI